MLTGGVYLDRKDNRRGDSREEGIGGVAVSNGREVAITDAAGQYSLPAPGAGLVWVSVPTGYRSVGPFYRQANLPSTNFRLVEEEQPEAFTFVYYTDLHLGEGLRGRERFAETLDEIASLEPRPAFCLDGGDITLQGGWGDGYKTLLEKFPLRVHHSAGNHEHLVKMADPKRPYRDLFGPTAYSFNYGGVHSVVLDAMKVDLTQEDWRCVVGEMSDDELDWLRADLAHTGTEVPVIVVTHVPLWTTFDERRGVGRFQEPAWLVMNYEPVLEALRPYDVRLVLQGHLHENEHHWEGGIHFLTSGSVCGSWWDDTGRCPDGAPEGYRIVQVRKGQITSVYKSTGKPRSHQLRIEQPATGSTVGLSFAVEANVFDGSERTEVAFSLDGVRWCPMRLEPSWLTETTRACAHRWVGDAHSANTPAGSHSLRVRASDPEWGTTSEFVEVIHL